MLLGILKTHKNLADGLNFFSLEFKYKGISDKQTDETIIGKMPFDEMNHPQTFQTSISDKKNEDVLSRSKMLFMITNIHTKELKNRCSLVRRIFIYLT